MAPSARSSHTELDVDGDEFDFGLQKTDRKVEPVEIRGESNNGTDIFFFFWFLTVFVNFADPETTGGEEEASANQ